MLQCCENFDSFQSDPKSQVIEIFPNIYSDSRGSFAEILKEDVCDHDNWISDLSWIKQVNRSKSSAATIRGCHAQNGPFCQGKLVQAVTGTVYDVITDARPDSQTFGTTSVFKLSSQKQNMLWVPRGFLHAFAVPAVQSTETIFEYFCDNVYDKASEIGVAPLSLLPKFAEHLSSVPELREKFREFVDMFDDTALEHVNLSEKDAAAEKYMSWMTARKAEFDNERKLWYR